MAILFSQFSAPTGQSVLRFTVCGNGLCGADENYQTCPEDCCDNDCTGKDDSVCHTKCGSYDGSPCSVSSGCNGIEFGQTVCADSSHYVTCCGGIAIACGIGTSCSSGTCVPCPVACTVDANCNDNNALTTDVCVNPGSCDANCSHSACVIACSGDGDCLDSNPNTTDKCLNPGACNASCSNATCVIACSADSECNDSDTATADKCENFGAIKEDYFRQKLFEFREKTHLLELEKTRLGSGG